MLRGYYQYKFIMSKYAHPQPCWESGSITLD